MVLEIDLGVGRTWPWRPGHRWARRPAFGECLGWLHRSQSRLSRRVASPPPTSSAVGTEASLALATLAFGYLIALIACFMRLRTTKGRWMLVRALAALVPVALWWLWLGHFFRFWLNNFCGDCSPPQPLIPDVFTFGNNVLVGAALLGLI